MGNEVESIGYSAKLAEALAKAQGEFLAIEKNKSVQIKSEKGSYSFRYADLEEMIAKTRPALAKHGLSVVQSIGVSPQGGVFLDTVLMHASGGALSSRLPLPDVGSMGDPKRFGALITYLRRYQYSAILCIAADDDLDDDGEDSRDSSPPPRQQTRSRPEPKAAADGAARKIGEGEVAYLRKKSEAAGFNLDEAVTSRFNCASVSDLDYDQFNLLKSELRALS
jgi:hypothetical protein